MENNDGKSVVDRVKENCQEDIACLNDNIRKDHTADEGENKLNQIAVEESEQNRTGENREPVPVFAQAGKDNAPEREFLDKRRNNRDVDKIEDGTYSPLRQRRLRQFAGKPDLLENIADQIRGVVRHETDAGAEQNAEQSVEKTDPVYGDQLVRAHFGDERHQQKRQEHPDDIIEAGKREINFFTHPVKLTEIERITENSQTDGEEKVKKRHSENSGENHPGEAV